MKQLTLFVVLWSLSFLVNGVAQDERTLTDRINNGSDLKKIVGKNLSECSIEEVKHGAILISHFSHDHTSSKKWFFDECKSSFPNDSKVMGEMDVQALRRQWEERSSRSAPSSSFSHDEGLSHDDEMDRGASDLLSYILETNDPQANMKFLPISVGSPKSYDKWIKKNISALKYLTTRVDIKVVAIPFAYHHFFSITNATGKKEALLLQAFLDLMASDKLVFMGGGDAKEAEYLISKKSFPFEFLNALFSTNRFILVGATRLGKGGEELLCTSSLQAGILAPHFMVAPGEDLEVLIHGDVTVLSTAVVSAATLILVNQFPNLTIDDVKISLFQSARKGGENIKTFSSLMGHGVLDVNAARLLCHEVGDRKAKEKEILDRKEKREAILGKCIYSPSWGSVLDTKSGNHQYWLPQEVIDSDNEKKERAQMIYFPSSISPKNILAEPTVPGKVQVFYLNIADATNKALAIFGITDVIPSEVRKIVGGIAVGYRYYVEDRKGNKTIIVSPSSNL